MLREISHTAPDRLTSHLEKEFGGVNTYGADSGAEPAKAAFEGHPLVFFARRIIAIRNVLRFPISFQERAFFLAEITLDTGSRNCIQLFTQRLT
jgi:hypothetical protein